MLSRAYDQACQAYFALLAKTFPGDLTTRMVASVERVLNFPFGQPQGHVPVGVSNPTLRSLWEARASLMKTFDGAGPWLMAAVVLLIGMESVRYALRRRRAPVDLGGVSGHRVSMAPHLPVRVSRSWCHRPVAARCCGGSCVECDLARRARC